MNGNLMVLTVCSHLL